MTALTDGWATALLIVLVAALAHEPWRWLGLYVGRDLDIDGAVFQWVKAVATALVSGLVIRLLLFPAGALAGVPGAARVLAFVAGITIFFAMGRSLAAGVAGGTAILAVASHLATG